MATELDDQASDAHWRWHLYWSVFFIIPFFLYLWSLGSAPIGETNIIKQAAGGIYLLSLPFLVVFGLLSLIGYYKDAKYLKKQYNSRPIWWLWVVAHVLFIPLTPTLYLFARHRHEKIRLDRTVFKYLTFR